MRKIQLTEWGAFAIIGIIVASFALSAVVVRAQSEQDGSWTVPRTPWGDPDLQGIWAPDGHAPTPMERPSDFGMREFLTPEEIATRLEAEREEFGVLSSDERIAGPRSFGEIEAGADFEDGIVGQEYNNFWIPHPDGVRKIWPRTSLVIDPPNGRLPPLTVAAADR